MSWLTYCRTATAALRVSRSFSTTSAAAFPRQTLRESRSREDEDVELDEDEVEPMDEMAITLEDFGFFEDPSDEEPFKEGDDDTTSVGHLMIYRQREKLNYLRLIDTEMPRLVAFRKPFIPPTSEAPVSVRSISYLTEDHPASNKRVLTVPVAHLPLKDEKAIHKLKLLAGARWSPLPPKDGGFRLGEADKHGYVKIACEDFPQPNMNLKWASDTLDRLVAEANKSPEFFAGVPVDTRHVEARVMRSGKGRFRRDLAGGRIREPYSPSLRDFPKEWLPPKSPKPASSTTLTPTPQ